MIEAVVFDLDDTLCVYRRSPAELLSVCFDTEGVDPFFDAADYYGLFDDHAEDSTDVEEIRARCFVELAVEDGRDPEVGRALASTYAAERDQTAVDPVPGARATLDSLSAPLALVTNGPPEMQSTKLRALGFEEYFDEIVFAGFETAAKPAPEPFEQALESLDVAPERAINVGNSPHADVLGASNAGMRSAWLQQDGGWDAAEGIDVQPDFVLESLHGLPDVLES